MAGLVKPLVISEAQRTAYRCLSSVAWSHNAIPKISKGPMTAHYKNLPKQPLPSLIGSLQKYLKAVNPLLTPAEFQETKMIVDEFGASNGIAKKLYPVLQERYNQLDNWIVDWWLEEEYLMNRTPLSPFLTPAAVISVEDFKSVDERLRFASTVLASALEYKVLVDKHQVKPDMLRGQPLDMSQHFVMFSTCRIPSRSCDRLVHFGDDTSSPKHIVVVRNNRFFQVDVFDREGSPLTENEIFEQLRLVMLQSEDEGIPVGLLTKQNRDVWAGAYERLCNDEINRHTVDMIQKALFVLSLDKAVPESYHSDTITRCLHNSLHGCGSDVNSGNRWIDKSFHLIIGEDGAFSLNMEPSPIEAQPLQRMIEHILTNNSSQRRKMKIVPSIVAEPRELRFNLSPQSLKDIEIAKLTINKNSDDVDIEHLPFHNFGGKFLKSQGLSTDSFIQMALQLAFYRLHGIRGVLCGVATLHRFYRANYDLIHSTSTEAIDFCQTMLDENASDTEKARALHRALFAHKNDVNEAVQGNGIDYLLLGLKRAAVESGLPIPSIYQDKAYKAYYNSRLISSQVPGNTYLPIYLSYGPFFNDGYGSPYFVYPEKLHFCFHSLKHSPETSSRMLLDCLHTSLLQMEDVIRNTTTSTIFEKQALKDKQMQ